MSFRDLLVKKLTKKELQLVPRSFDLIGSKDKAVAIIEIPEKLGRRKKVIANAIMRQHPNVKTVLAKASARQGTYRTRKYEFLKGDRNTEVIHVENGCRFLLDVRKTYFSPREGTERQRIARLVQKNEIVMVFFAGIGPFAVLIAKKSKPKRVVGIEVNEDAVRYFWENVRLNKLDNVDVVHGDVREKAGNYYGQCSRVIMPLPEKAADFLNEAAGCLEKKGIIHLYFFSDDGKISDWRKKIRKILRKKTIRIHNVSKVLPYGPGISKYRMDIEVEN